MNKIHIILLFITSIHLNSQELLYERDVKLKAFFEQEKKESFPVVNYEKNEIVMFLLDKKEIKSFLFDMNYVLKDSFTTSRPKGKFDYLLGYTFDDDKYNLIFTNENKTKFFNKSINIKHKRYGYNELELKLKRENFLESFSYRNNFYFITLKKSSSILSVYEIKGNKISRVKKIDLSGHKFTKSSRSLYYVLYNNKSEKKDVNVLNKIDNKNPNSIDLASNPNKIYCYNNTIHITLDVYDNFTKVISINMEDFKFNVNDYDMAKVDCDHDLGIKSNSYLLEDKIYQVSGCKNELYFSISDINTGKKLKERNVKKDDVIDFKNTPLIQLGGTFNKNKKYRELNETEQILRKIEASRIGVSAYEVNGNLEITIGGYKKMATKELIAIGAVVTIGGAVLATGVPSYREAVDPNNHYYYSNPTMLSYKSYSYARSVYFKSLLNNDFENITDNINDNAFDKVRKHEIDHRKEISSETMFKVNDYFVYGYYNKKKSKYYLLKFKD